MKINQKGYSLIELITVIVIFVIIFTVTVVNFRAGERTQELRLVADQVATEIRKAQTQALAGIGEDTDLSIDYGLFFISGFGSYAIFKDTDSDKEFDAPEELIRSIILPEGVTVSEVSTDTLPLNIIFEPPKPVIYINGSTAALSAEITLMHDGVTSKKAVINLNRVTGRVNSELVTIP
ncbi:prepilin-type N-terminal cleavage/methylation domain-containing protein [bacterium]|jgi:prepilin-type N-terminal cleavage/methylation domain-containing protein|nr:prepilin-type N-terminal cleavage/methylation domain-containing protein [bacterium]MBT4335204.1 prepilin-type N-terminal cleavage/methylation domain-containing protein [bacterium]MBT4495990.1 prepilin-type N-terminal cleavage/methylation domain-containing protein [bacterium]MBT4763492.1 prepilin-type N-terminal cleavage/methylation domain-containing protein [bacterium]MBT5400863.1 prepilin-type N-terminal cleavage/methylation domain-containing protein [bacterium]